MSRARKTKTKPKRKRSTKRHKAVTAQSQNGWQIGAGLLALAILLGAGAYFVTMNDNARTSVANFVERIEVPQAVKEFPDKVKQSLPAIPAISANDGKSGNQESAPAQ